MDVLRRIAPERVTTEAMRRDLHGCRYVDAHVQRRTRVPTGAGEVARSDRDDINRGLLKRAKITLWFYFT